MDGQTDRQTDILIIMIIFYLIFTTYGSITTIQYSMQYETIEHNKQCELN